MRGIVGPIWSEDDEEPVLLGVEIQDGHGGIHALPTEAGVRRIVREELQRAAREQPVHSFRREAADAAAREGLGDVPGGSGGEEGS